MKTKILIALVLLSGLLTLQWRRELMMHVMMAAGTGAPPPLLDLTDEGPGVLWLADYFTIELVAPDTYAIGEPRYWQKNYSYLIIGSATALPGCCEQNAEKTAQCQESTDSKSCEKCCGGNYSYAGKCTCY